MFFKTFIAIACTGFIVATSAQAQEFPSKNVTLMMPYAAGGPGDTLTRIIGQGMSKVLSRPFLVENVAGAGGTPGTAEAPASLCLGAVKRCVGARFSLRVAGGTAAVCGRGASAQTTSVVQFARNRLIGILKKSPADCGAGVRGRGLAYLALFDSI